MSSLGRKDREEPNVPSRSVNDEQGIERELRKEVWKK